MTNGPLAGPAVTSRKRRWRVRSGRRTGQVERVTVVSKRAEAPARPAVGMERDEPLSALDILGSTDHKIVGLLYLVTAFGFFLFAGLLAMAMRAELARPGL